MRIPPYGRARQRGSTLVTIMILGTIALVAAGSLLAWTSTSNKLSDRNNEYYRAVAAAEGATEKVITRISSDYRKGGEALNSANLSSYRTQVPTSAENAIMGNFRFTDGQNNVSKTYVEWLPPSQFKALNSQYQGLMGYATSFRIVSNAKDTTTHWGITAGVHQEVDVATIPLFQFAIFYNLDLEIHPGAAMTVTGPVHGNLDVYIKPRENLTFQGDVTAAGSIITGQREGNCEEAGSGTITFDGLHNDTANQLNMPIGTNGSPANVREVVEYPPVGELATSPMGQQRFYNKADLIIELSGSFNAPVTTVKSGLYNNFAKTVLKAEYVQTPTAGWLDYDNTFFNKREGKTVRTIDIDVAKFKKWSENNTSIRPSLGRDVSTIYVIDRRTNFFGATDEPGVRLLNGHELPSLGLTVATPDPIYVWGDYNNKISGGSGSGGTSTGIDTTYTRPAALIGDAITVLSKDWKDANSNGALSLRKAQATIVNAAIIAGINQSTNCNYSGGVENFPRFLEDWSNITFTYNGSMVVLYESKWATGLWRGTGSTLGIYNPPVRNWAFDQNFRIPAKLPPSTPCARTLIRGSYAVTRPNSTTPFTP